MLLRYKTTPLQPNTNTPDQPNKNTPLQSHKMHLYSQTKYTQTTTSNNDEHQQQGDKNNKFIFMATPNYTEHSPEMRHSARPDRPGKKAQHAPRHALVLTL
eukprot:12921870-Alexandrium_andersonii.AAC.1